MAIYKNLSDEDKKERDNLVEQIQELYPSVYNKEAQFEEFCDMDNSILKSELEFLTYSSNKKAGTSSTVKFNELQKAVQEEEDKASKSCVDIAYEILNTKNEAYKEDCKIEQVKRQKEKAILCDVSLALMAGENNAYDTTKENTELAVDSEEYYENALGSISSTEQVTDGEYKKEVIAWFEKHNHII